jgi:hypothetical protein
VSIAKLDSLGWRPVWRWFSNPDGAVERQLVPLTPAYEPSAHAVYAAHRALPTIMLLNIGQRPPNLIIYKLWYIHYRCEYT